MKRFIRLLFLLNLFKGSPLIISNHWKGQVQEFRWQSPFSRFPSHFLFQKFPHCFSSLLFEPTLGFAVSRIRMSRSFPVIKFLNSHFHNLTSLILECNNRVIAKQRSCFLSKISRIFYSKVFQKKNSRELKPTRVFVKFSTRYKNSGISPVIDQSH